MSETKVLDITHIPIHRGADIQSAMRATGDLIAKAPGFRIAYWGVQIEHNDTMDLLVEWDSVAHHKSHLGTDLEKEITGVVWPLIDTSRAIVTSHIPLDNSVHRTCFEAPIVEVCTYKNVQDSSVFEESIVLLDKAARKSEAYRGMVYGRKLEEYHRKEFAAIIGWSSVEDHVVAPKKSLIVEEIKKVRELAGDAEFHHVVLTQWMA